MPSYRFIMIRDTLPLKWSILKKTISITIGMPILRTSVDHGTALNIAGQGHRQSGEFD